MKKLFVILFAVGASVLTSCDNENSVNPQPLGTAKITGTVYADFDYTNNSGGVTWDKVANKKIIIAIYDDYTNTQRITETTTDANGNYSIELKVGNNGLEVELWLVDFKHPVKISADETEEILFYGEWFNTGVNYVVKGGEYIRDIYYND